MDGAGLAVFEQGTAPRRRFLRRQTAGLQIFLPLGIAEGASATGPAGQYRYDHAGDAGRLVLIICLISYCADVIGTHALLKMLTYPKVRSALCAALHPADARSLQILNRLIDSKTALH